MESVFIKIKERLEDKSVGFYDDVDGKLIKVDKAIEIVNHVAEEYDGALMYSLIEAKKNCGEDSDCSECPFGQFEDMCVLEELQIDRKEPEYDSYSDGWIPVSSGKLPEEKENPVTECWYVYPVMIQFDDISDIRYYSFGNGHWHYGPNIMDEYVTHWMDIKPYRTEGE